MRAKKRRAGPLHNKEHSSQTKEPAESAFAQTGNKEEIHKTTN